MLKKNNTKLSCRQSYQHVVIQAVMLVMIIGAAFQRRIRLQKYQTTQNVADIETVKYCNIVWCVNGGKIVLRTYKLY